MPSRTEHLVVAALALAAGLVFTVWPQADLAITGWAYTPGEGFTLDRLAPVKGLYWFVWGASRLAIIAFLLLWLAALLVRTGWLARYRRWFGFMLLAIALGPGLITDVALKNHWGRARPHQVAEFGGTQTFTPALLPADQCARNCSFVSGHVSGAAALMAFGWLAPPPRRRRWLLGAAAASLLVGTGRVVQGGHFASDVLFAFFAVWLGTWLAATLLARAGKLPGPAQIPTAWR